ncbi:MAG: hypothetical protein GF311_02140 [Candidatus Lokiarchaeota archaeon]|nr:hypothetical protein [Candidatus Lokiarchaeota archaeon]
MYLTTDHIAFHSYFRILLELLQNWPHKLWAVARDLAMHGRWAGSGACARPGA